MDSFITEVRLHHTLYTGLANQIYGTNNEPVVPQKPNKGIIHMDVPFHVHTPSTTTSTSTTTTERPIVETTKLPAVEMESK